MSIEQNKATVRKFVEALNERNLTLLAETGTPAVVQDWTTALPGMYARMNEHHIDITEIVAEGDNVAIKTATRGLHSGEMYGIPPTGKPWTNRVFIFFHFVDGKIETVEPIPDTDNFIKQIGGTMAF